MTYLLESLLLRPRINLHSCSLRTCILSHHIWIHASRVNSRIHSERHHVLSCGTRSSPFELYGNVGLMRRQSYDTVLACKHAVLMFLDDYVKSIHSICHPHKSSSMQPTGNDSKQNHTSYNRAHHGRYDSTRRGCLAVTYTGK